MSEVKKSLGHNPKEVEDQPASICSQMQKCLNLIRGGGATFTFLLIISSREWKNTIKALVYVSTIWNEKFGNILESIFAEKSIVGSIWKK